MSRVARVETFLVGQDLDPPFGPSPVTIRRLETIIVKVTDDDGRVGWGEAPDIAAARAMIDQALGPRLIGQDPRDTRRLWQLLWGPNFGHSFAVAGLDMALHDLRGKVQGLSLSQLYGGGFRDRVLAYASGVNYVEGREIEENWPAMAADYLAQGYRAMKVRIGRHPPAREMPILEKVRAALPPDVKLMVDGNAAYSLPTAIRVGRELERLGVYWYEEPMPQADYAAYEVLTAHLDIPIAGGEALQNRSAFAELIRRRAVDIVQPDVSLCGGIGEWLFIAELARLHRVPCVPHAYGGGLLLAATTHCLALMPEPTAVAGNDPAMLEVGMPPPVYQRALLKNPLIPVDGYVAVPTGPGLGVDIDEDILREYSV